VAKELEFFLGDDTPIFTFPDWECLPYDRVSPHPDIVSQRLLALHRLPHLDSGVLIIPITALMQRLAPTNYIDAHTFDLAVNDDIDIETFRQRLIDAGYYSVDTVMAAGEFAIRGGIVDVFPSGMDSPFRLDLFDTTIETIRLFDTETQRSTDTLDKIQLLPAREFPLDSQSVEAFRQAFRATVDGDAKQSIVYREVSKGLAPTGSEFYLPLFFKETNTLFDFLPENTSFVLEEGVMENAETLHQEVIERYQNASLNPEWPPLEPELLFLSPEKIFAGFKEYPRAQLLNLNLKSAKHVIDFDTKPASKFSINPRSENPYAEFMSHLDNASIRTLIVAESAGRRESIIGLLNENKRAYQTVESWNEFITSDAKLAITVAEVDRGLSLGDTKVEIITESQLYGERTFQRRKRSDKNRDPDAIIKSLAELNIGDPVVHDDHGVGRYRGLETLNVDGSDNEFATLEYQGGDKIYIPVLALDKVSRYVGAPKPHHYIKWVAIRG